MLPTARAKPSVFKIHGVVRSVAKSEISASKERIKEKS
jgi:hypothetical protein